MKPTLYTIGHSTRTYDELVETLRAWDVDDARRHPLDHAVAHEPSVQPHVARAPPAARRPRYVVHARARRAAAALEDRRSGAQCGLARRRVPQLRRLRGDARVRGGAGRAARACGEADVRDHVRRGRVVALSSPDRRRLRADPRRARLHIFTATKVERATRTPFAKLDRRTRTLRYPVTADPPRR